jgi:dTDP-4-amino-4,6-dideoxygalactose transaminase
VTPILMTGLQSEPDALKSSMSEAVARTLASHRFILGQEVQRFEQSWGSYCDTAHAVGVANGLDALEVALRSLGIGHGDEVIVPGLTAFATALAVARCGAIPLVADVDPRSGLLDRASVERCLSDKTRAVILVHLYGQVREASEWVRYCASRNLLLIEDCAQAHGAAEGGVTAGAFGHAGAYSFYPTKNLGCFGDGGALITNSGALAERARVLRNYGQSRLYHHEFLGLNSRLDEVQAAILSTRLEWLDEFIESRRAHARDYRARIRQDRVRLLDEPTEPSAHVYHQFVITCDRRDSLAEYLDARGVQTQIHYPLPIHLQPAAGDFRHDPAGLPVAESLAATCLSIPCHPQLTQEDRDRVVDAINAFQCEVSG